MGRAVEAGVEAYFADVCAAILRVSQTMAGIEQPLLQYPALGRVTPQGEEAID